MPNEIQAHILCQLEVRDILALRLTSHSLSDILQLNASSISRSVLYRTIKGDTKLYLEILYPQPRSLSSLSYFFQMLHRQAVVDKMVIAVTDFVQYKIYQIKSTSRQRQFAPVRRRMLWRLKTPAFIIYHFLETLRRAVLEPYTVPSSCSSTREPLHWWLPERSSEICWNCTHLQCRLISTYYPVSDLLSTLQFFRIMLSAFRQKLQPPTYAGSIERRLRGWNREAASDADLTKSILLGGMKEMLNIMGAGKFIPRLLELKKFVARIDETGGLQASDERLRTLSTKEIECPEVAGILLARTLLISNTPVPPPSVLFQMAARSRLVTAAVATGEVETKWAIPDAFTFIQDIVTDRETRLGESAQFDPNIDFERRAQEPDEDDEEEGDGPMPSIPG